MLRSYTQAYGLIFMEFLRIYKLPKQQCLVERTCSPSSKHNVRIIALMLVKSTNLFEACIKLDLYILYYSLSHLSNQR